MQINARSRLVTTAVSVAAFVGASSPVTAQATADATERLVLRGTIVDGVTGEPLHGAFIAPLGSETGYLTHENGTFALPVLPQSDYYLYAELIGYETYRFEISGPDPEVFVVTLRPNPIELEGIRVLVDRFERRRKGVAVQVRSLSREDLVSAPITDVVDYMGSRFGIFASYCGGGTSGGAFGTSSDCVYRRGRLVQPRVYIDEIPAFGGLDELREYRPQDLYTLEVYDRGTTILAYTHHFVDRVLKGGRHLMPLAFLR